MNGPFSCGEALKGRLQQEVTVRTLAGAEVSSDVEHKKVGLSHLKVRVLVISTVLTLFANATPVLTFDLEKVLRPTTFAAFSLVFLTVSSVVSWLGFLVSPILLFVILYFFERRDLASDYKGVILSLFMGGLVGEVTGYWLPVILFGQSAFPDLASVLWFAASFLQTTLSSALATVFVGFTAIYLPRIREASITS